MATKELLQPIGYETVARLAEYYQEQSNIRYRLAETIYKDAVAMLLEWQSFMDGFNEGGRFEGLSEQLAADAATGITQEEIATMQGCLTTIVATMMKIEYRSPGMFNITLTPGLGLEV